MRLLCAVLIMKIYRLKKDWSYIIGNGSIGFHMNYKKGDLFFKLKDTSDYDTIGPDYYPENGSYAVSERYPIEYTHKKKKYKIDAFMFVDEYLEFVGETDKPKSYFINKKYSQAEVDEMLSKK